GPNNLQNYPTLIDAITNPSGTSVQIHFTLMSEPSRSYRVEFFGSPLADPSGYGEGRSYLGTVNATTDANGTASGTFTAATLPAGNVYFTATASQLTGANSGVTSEFSPAVHGTLPPPPPTPQDVTTVTGRSVFYNDSKFE